MSGFIDRNVDEKLVAAPYRTAGHRIWSRQDSSKRRELWTRPHGV